MVMWWLPLAVAPLAYLFTRRWVLTLGGDAPDKVGQAAGVIALVGLYAATFAIFR